MFEYQTAICELTGLPVSNASRLRGPERRRRRRLAGASSHNKRTRFLVSAACTRTRARRSRRPRAGWGTTVEEIPLARRRDRREAARASATTSPRSSSQQPNFLGAVEDLEALRRRRQEAGALLIVQADPLTLGVLRPPGDFDVDIAVGEGQTLGNRLDFGGPSFGFFAAQEAYLRRMPGRIAGETTDVDGRRGFVLTLQTREQHIRREKATHNICTAQALNALAGRDLPELARPRGLVELGELLLQRTAYARETLAAIDGVELLHEQPVVREFAVKLDAPVARGDRALRGRGRQPRLPARRDTRTTACWWRSPSSARKRGHRPARRRARGGSAMSGRRRTACTRPGHRRPRAASQRSARRDAACSATARRRSSRSPSPAGARSSRPSSTCPSADDAARALPPRRAAASCRRSPSRRSSATTTGSRKRNFDLDTGFYPLGSCTMKHNPKLHERVAALPGNARLHPLQDPERAQGALQLMYELQGALAEVAGLPHVSLQPSRRLARRARRRAAHARLPRGPRRARARRSSRPTPRTAPTRRR